MGLILLAVMGRGQLKPRSPVDPTPAPVPAMEGAPHERTGDGCTAPGPAKCHQFGRDERGEAGVDLILQVMVGAVRGGTSILYAALGETLSERAGVINLGTEGCMLVGALSAYAVTAQTGNPWAGLVAGAAGRRAAGPGPRGAGPDPEGEPAGHRPGGAVPGPGR